MLSTQINRFWIIIDMNSNQLVAQIWEIETGRISHEIISSQFSSYLQH